MKITERKSLEKLKQELNKTYIKADSIYEVIDISARKLDNELPGHFSNPWIFDFKIFNIGYKITHIISLCNIDKFDDIQHLGFQIAMNFFAKKD